MNCSQTPSCALARTLLLTALIAGAVACDQSPTDTVPGSAVYVRFAEESLFVGQTRQITAVATGDDSAAVAWPQFTWNSADTSVAVVNESGLVLGLDIGTTVVSARLGNRRDSIVVRVVLKDVSDGQTFAGMAVGENHLCALSSAGTAYCSPWTFNEAFPVFSPLPNAASVSLVSLRASRTHQCGLTASNDMYCWGSNSAGQFMDGAMTPASTPNGPVAAGGVHRFSAVATAADNAQVPTARYSCAIESTTRLVRCAGYNGNGQLGRTGATIDTTAAVVGSGLTATRISTSARHACAIDDSSGLWCWGGGLLSANSATPRAVLPGVTFDDVYVADHTVCARHSGGTLMCAPVSPTAPIGAAVLTHTHATLRFSAILSGTTWERPLPNVVTPTPYSCGVTPEGDLYCWGDFPPRAVSTRLGERRLTPVPLARGVKFRSIAADSHHLCGVTTSDKLLCM